jgi:hypothetical protein
MWKSGMRRVLRRAENMKGGYWLRFMRPISLLLFPRLNMDVVSCIDYQRSEKLWKNVNRLGCLAEVCEKNKCFSYQIHGA